MVITSQAGNIRNHGTTQSAVCNEGVTPRRNYHNGRRGETPSLHSGQACLSRPHAMQSPISPAHNMFCAIRVYGRDKLEPDAQRRVSRLLGGSRETIETYKCHTFVVVKYPDGHPMAEGYEERRRYWRDWFSTPQEYSLTSKRPAPSRGRKGFVRMELDSSGDYP